MEQIRLFIAIELPEEIRSCLSQIQEILKSANPACAKWVDPRGIHLTLKFLGGVKLDIIDSIIESMKEAAKVATPFQLRLNGLGAFPNLRRLQVVWVGMSGDLDKLQFLQNKLESNLSSLGFIPENRAFTPHLTLARLRENVSLPERQTMGEIIAKTGFQPDLYFEVKSISLMKSQLTHSGAIYTRMQLVKLGFSLPIET